MGKLNQDIIKLALAITKKNIVKREGEVRKYSKNRVVKPKDNAINKLVNTVSGSYYYIKGNMHEAGFLRMKKNNAEAIKNFNKIGILKL